MAVDDGPSDRVGAAEGDVLENHPEHSAPRAQAPLGTPEGSGVKIDQIDVAGAAAEGPQRHVVGVAGADDRDAVRGVDIALQQPPERRPGGTPACCSPPHGLGVARRVGGVRRRAVLAVARFGARHRRGERGG